MSRAISTAGAAYLDPAPHAQLLNVDDPRARRRSVTRAEGNLAPAQTWYVHPRADTGGSDSKPWNASDGPLFPRAREPGRLAETAKRRSPGERLQERAGSSRETRRIASAGVARRDVVRGVRLDAQGALQPPTAGWARTFPRAGAEQVTQRTRTRMSLPEVPRAE